MSTNSKIIEEIHNKTKKSKFLLFFDIINCKIKYKANSNDYKLFEMYRVSKDKRKTFVTKGINNKIIHKFNNIDYNHFFDNKLDFNKKYNRFLNREWLKVTEDNYDEFKEFALKHKQIVIKPINESNEKNIEIIDINDKNIKRTYNNILKTNRLLVEEVIKQSKELSSLHKESINSLRIVTLNQQIVASYIRIGTGNSILDNLYHGGIIAPINIDTGIIDYPAIDKKGKTYEIHPDTGEPIIWFQIPKWNRIKRFAIECSKIIPEMSYISWDICLGENGPLLIDGNNYPNHEIYQLPPHRNNDIGILPIFKKAMNRKEDLNENSDSN